jgi:hypothetical protein
MATSRIRTAIVLTVGLVLVLPVLAHWAPPTAGRLRHEIDDLTQPGWQLVDEELGGSPTCLDYCRYAVRTYRVDRPPADLYRQLRPTLAQRGYRELPWSGPDSGAFHEGDGAIDVTVSVDPDGTGSLVTVTAGS